MNAELTIILLVKDRPGFVLRWLKYHNQNPPSFPVLITDSGEDDTIEKHLKDKSLYPNIKYTYVRFSRPKDRIDFLDQADLNEKIYDALTRINTKYAVLEADDDFNFDQGLVKAVEFLNKNPEYVVSRGEVYDFRVRPLNEKNRKENIYGKITGVRKLYMSESNVKDSAMERALEFSKYSDSLWLDVTHTDKYREAYKTLLDSKIVDRNTGANLVSYLLVAKGKVHRGEGLYILHQSHLLGWAHLLVQVDPLEIVLTESWPEDINKLFELSAIEVAKHDQISNESARNKIMQYYTYYIFGKAMIEGHKRPSKKSSKIFSLSHYLSKDNSIRIFLRNLYEYLRENKEESRSNQMIESSAYSGELKKIRDFLLNS